jgi:hypothetical protein
MNPTEYNFPTVVRHVYDIDAFEIIDKLKEKYNSSIEKGKEQLKDLEFISLTEEILIKFLNEEGVDSSEHKKHRNYIMSSHYNLYNTYLGYKLLTIDLYKIEPLLSFQSVLFLGNYYASKNNFLGLVEFLVYDFVKTGVLPSEQIRLEKIVNWLERNREFLLNKAYNEPSDGIIEEQKDDTVVEFEAHSKKGNLKHRIVIMDAQFANVFYEKVKCFFEGQETLLYDLIIKNEFTELLVFNGQSNQIAELFKRLRYNSKITVSTIDVLANWIVKHFSTRNKQNEIEKLNLSTISQVLKKSSTEPSKGKRILEDLAQFIVSTQRKKDKELPKK